MNRSTSEIVKEINDRFEHDGSHLRAYETTSDNQFVIEVSRGDWKHEHLYVKFVVREIAPYLKLEVYNEEHDGSDCYSADYYYSKAA